MLSETALNACPVSDEQNIPSLSPPIRVSLYVGFVVPIPILPSPISKAGPLVFSNKVVPSTWSCCSGSMVPIPTLPWLVTKAFPVPELKKPAVPLTEVNTPPIPSVEPPKTPCPVPLVVPNNAVPSVVENLPAKAVPLPSTNSLASVACVEPIATRYAFGELKIVFPDPVKVFGFHCQDFHPAQKSFYPGYQYLVLHAIQCQHQRHRAHTERT